jgi:hypothetical protein
MRRGGKFSDDFCEVQFEGIADRNTLIRIASMHCIFLFTFILFGPSEGLMRSILDIGSQMSNEAPAFYPRKKTFMKGA